jgi:hypothetical protein
MRKIVCILIMYSFMCSASDAKEMWTVFGYGENGQIWVKNKIGEQILCRPTVADFATVGMQVFISGKTIIIGDADKTQNKWIIITGSDTSGSSNIIVTLDGILQDKALTQEFVSIWKGEIAEGLDRYGWLAEWVEYLTKGKENE